MSRHGRELCDRSAVELRDLIRQARISPVELLESCVRRIEAVNPGLNAVVAMDLDRAMEDASAAEAAVRDGTGGPLTGLPVGIKDLNATAGLRTTWGSPLYAEHVPAKDEAMVAKLRDAGAVVLAKTNTPMFGAGTKTDNPVYGPTRNPHDRERTSGGSSGGSAAAVATGMLPLAQGSDTGGSLRNPATWCGCVGFRPTPGLVPRPGRTLNYTHFNVQGPMARSVADCALMMAGLAADDGRDPLSAPVAAGGYDPLAAVDLAGLRVAVSEDFGGIAPLDDGIRESFQRTVGRLAPAFAECTPRDPDFTQARDVFWALRCVYFVANHRARYDDPEVRSTLSPNIVANVEAGLAMSLADVADAEVKWSALYARFQDFFRDIDLLILPGNATSAFRLDDGIPTEVGGRPMQNYMDASLIRSAVTLTGHPVVALPLGRDHLGLPFGIQIVGPRRADAFTLAAAAAIEAHAAGDPELAPPRPDLETLTA